MADEDGQARRRKSPRNISLMRKNLPGKACRRNAFTTSNLQDDLVSIDGRPSRRGGEYAARDHLSRSVSPKFGKKDELEDHSGDDGTSSGDQLGGNVPDCIPALLCAPAIACRRQYNDDDCKDDEYDDVDSVDDRPCKRQTSCPERTFTRRDERDAGRLVYRQRLRSSFWSFLFQLHPDCRVVGLFETIYAC